MQILNILGSVISLMLGVLILYISFENHEIEYEFPRITLPRTVSMRVGMPVKVFYLPESGQSYVYSVGKPNPSVICMIIALVLFTVAVLFFTGIEV